MKVYPVGLVGESNYQDPIRSCHRGEAVAICFERDNPYDDRALRVENDAGRVIGYVPKTNWLREAIHEEGRGVAATIKSIDEADKGLLGVVLDVTLTDDALPERFYGVEERRSFWGLFRR
jgi:hypothetical protein